MRRVSRMSVVVWMMVLLGLSLVTTPVHASAKIDLNTATVAELVQLKGIGMKYAERIVAYRMEHGPFESVDDLVHVKGIGKKTVEKLREYLVVESGKK